MAYKKLKYWFDKELAKLLANKIVTVHPAFSKRKFVNAVNKKVDDLELKDRVEVMADELHFHLEDGYVKNIKTLLKILGPENEEETGMFTNFYWVMPIAKYVEKYGLENFDISMKAIEEITKRNTGEYTIRPFIEKYTQPTLKVMKDWSTNTNSHVRRLACEGVRPRLPWAKKLDQFIKNPKPIIPILNNLKDDPSKYVQKSVANCVNDIFKDNPEVAKKQIEKWNTKNKTTARKWIIKHALRNLIKRKNDWAIKMVQ